MCFTSKIIIACSNIFEFVISISYAEMSELADEQDSGSCVGFPREGSSPFFRTTLSASGN